MKTKTLKIAFNNLPKSEKDRHVTIMTRRLRSGQFKCASRRFVMWCIAAAAYVLSAEADAAIKAGQAN